MVFILRNCDSNHQVTHQYISNTEQNLFPSSSHNVNSLILCVEEELGFVRNKTCNLNLNWGAAGSKTSLQKKNITVSEHSCSCTIHVIRFLMNENRTKVRKRQDYSFEIGCCFITLLLLTDRIGGWLCTLTACSILASPGCGLNSLHSAWCLRLRWRNLPRQQLVQFWKKKYTVQLSLFL